MLSVRVLFTVQAVSQEGLSLLEIIYFKGIKTSKEELQKHYPTEEAEWRALPQRRDEGPVVVCTTPGRCLLPCSLLAREV